MIDQGLVKISILIYKAIKKSDMDEYQKLVRWYELKIRVDKISLRG